MLIYQEQNAVNGEDINERFGLELANSVSRLDKLERERAEIYKNKQQEAVLADIMANRVDALEQEVQKIHPIETNVNKLEDGLRRTTNDLKLNKSDLDKVSKTVDTLKDIQKDSNHRCPCSIALFKILKLNRTHF